MNKIHCKCGRVCLIVEREERERVRERERERERERDGTSDVKMLKC